MLTHNQFTIAIFQRTNNYFKLSNRQKDKPLAQKTMTWN